jgi:hypothetical protein
MSHYGLHSRRVLTFLKENPGATAREISEHLFDGRSVEQVHVQYRHSSKTTWHRTDPLKTQWQAKRYVLEHMMNSEWYEDVLILDERVQLVSKICRGKFAYLTSPYNCRTLSADPFGTRAHPGAANRNAQRRWWWRTKHEGVYHYFLTTRGLGAVEEHGHV